MYVCALCCYWELGKKTKKFATLEMEGGRRRDKKGSLFTHKDVTLSRKGGVVGSPNQFFFPDDE